MGKNTSYEVTRAKQSNHQDFHTPQSIRHLGEMPLYQAVVWWGYYLEREFSRDELSRAFRIDHRRASAILNYICHRLNNQEVVLEFHNKSVDGGRCRLYVKVTSVSLKKCCAPKKTGPVVNEREPLISKEQERELSRWLLSRPSSTDKDRLEKWKAACPVIQKE